MAKGGRAVLDVTYGQFFKNLELLMTRVDRGTKKATLAAVKEIYEESQKQVPRETSTLASSGYYGVEGNYRIGFTGVVGYGGNGDPVNPKTGERASHYMIAVHEDLTAVHPTGKAKFLEDPIKEYQARALGRFATFIKNETRI